MLWNVAFDLANEKLHAFGKPHALRDVLQGSNCAQTASASVPKINCSHTHLSTWTPSKLPKHSAQRRYIVDLGLLLPRQGSSGAPIILYAGQCRCSI